MTKTVFKIFRDLIKRFPWHFIALLALIFTQVIFNILTVVAIAPITDILMEKTVENFSQITKVFNSIFYKLGSNMELMHVFIFFASVTILNSIAAILVEFSILRIKNDVLIHLLTNTISNFFRAKFLFFSQGDMGVMLNSVQQEVSKVGNTFGSIARLTANFLNALIFLILPFSISPSLTIYFILIAGVISSPLWLLHRFSYSLGKQNTETANKMTGILHEALTAAKLIISFGSQQKTVDRYNQSIINHAKVSVKFHTLLGAVSKLFYPLGIVAALSALYISYLNNMPLATMAMILFSLNRLVPVIGLLLTGKTTIEGFVPAFEQLEKLNKDAKLLEVSNGDLIFNTLQNKIELKNISFNYPERELTLNNINVTISKGKLTALLGKSGSGKSTLVDLILGLYEKNNGSILIDGEKLESFDLNTFRDKIGYVPQEPQLFNTSIRENFLWSYPNASEQDMWEACEISNSKNFVFNLPNKLDTELGDRGVRLSGGQRQRLALARALIRKPELLILDEATSSLDSESENLIQKSIDSLIGKVSIIIIAHRISTIRNADYVYILDNGKIVEKGTFKTLSSRKNSHLKTMIDKQNI